jgi:CO/xanthine dehydrogenase Mo-binding subunit
MMKDNFEHLHVSRRDFLKIATVSGVTVYCSTLGFNSFAASAPEAGVSAVADWGGAGNASPYRIDGLVKVKGQKLFARDIRAQDVPGWPKQQAHGLILRINKADRPYLGLDLSRLSPEAQPKRIITAKDLARDKLDFPPFFGTDMLLPEGKVAPLLGQAVAILIFSDYESFRLARNALQFKEDIFKFGPVTGPLALKPWGTFRSVRINGATPYDDNLFSSLQDDTINPLAYSGNEPIWPKASAQGNASERGMYFSSQIEELLDKPPANWVVLDKHYQTQSTDAFAMETENGNGWYDARSQSLHLILSVQKPQEVIDHALEMLKASSVPVKSLYVQPTYTVGYGSKDSSNHTYYSLVAALYGDGLPVRVALNRYENFQASLKRHAFSLHYRLAVNTETKKIEVFQSDVECNGGGRSSFSPSIMRQSTIQSAGIYYIPKCDLRGQANATRALDASAIRGFGSLQSVSAMEMLADEMAQSVDMDAIDFRLHNAIRTGYTTAQGAVPSGQVRIIEVLNQAKKHPIWTERALRKQTFEQANPDKLYGAGFGCAQKSFGTGREAAFAKIEIGAEGRITIYHPGVEMGTGIAMTQAVVCKPWFGQAAHEVKLGVTDWRDLPMEQIGNANTNKQADEDHWSRTNPRWTPHYVSSSGATNTAYYFTHATKEAARVVCEFGLWPAALAIWSQGPNGGQFSTARPNFEQMRWIDGKMTAAGLEPLSLETLAAKAHALGLVTGALVHTFNRWQWAQAEFELDGQRVTRLVDGLSVRRGSSTVDNKATPPGRYQILPRLNVKYPSVDRFKGAMTLFCAMGTLAEIAVDKKTGAVEVLNHHSILECGNVMVPELVAGQIEGAMSMGIGHALMEYLPLYEDGPGNGDWNLDRYRIPRASDVAVWKQTHEVLPPLSDTDPPKGMAEVAIIPVVPAIVNAVAHATGKRFYELPITPEKIKGVL